MLANSSIVEDWKTAVNHQSDMEYGKESWGTDLTGLANLSGLSQNAAILSGMEAGRIIKKTATAIPLEWYGRCLI
jgi:hypothetical protein